MKKFIAIVLAVSFLVLPCSRAQWTAVLAGSPPAGGGEPTYLVSENFESGSLPTNWFNYQADFTQSTSGLSLQGSKCMSMVGASAYCLVLGNTSSMDMAEFWMRFMIRPTELGSAFLNLFDASYNTLVAIYTTSGGKLGVSGGSNPETVATMSVNTSYYVWVHYLKGSGSNGVCEVWWSTNSTKPADGTDYHAKTTTGTWAVNIAWPTFTNSSALQETYFDEVRIAASSIP